MVERPPAEFACRSHENQARVLRESQEFGNRLQRATLKLRNETDFGSMICGRFPSRARESFQFFIDDRTGIRFNAAFQHPVVTILFEFCRTLDA